METGTDYKKTFGFKKNKDSLDKKVFFSWFIVIFTVICSIILYSIVPKENWWIWMMMGGVFLLFAASLIPSTDYSFKEGFSMNPHYVGTDFHSVIVPPALAEEWRIPPPVYKLNTNVSNCSGNKGTVFLKDEKTEKEEEVEIGKIKGWDIPQNIPYGQYINSVNTLPCDNYPSKVAAACGGKKQVTEYVNSLWLRENLTYRQNISELYKKRLAYQFMPAGCQDTWSPYQSY